MPSFIGEHIQLKAKHSCKTRKLDLFCFCADPPIWLLTLYLSEGKEKPHSLGGLLAVFWLMVENTNIKMTAHIVLHLKRHTWGNHQENKTTQISGCSHNYFWASSTLSWNLSVATMLWNLTPPAAKICNKQETRDAPPTTDR